MISRSGIHAIRAVTSLAGLEEGVFAGASLLAREIGAPGNYLGKLLQTLTRSGLVESRKGAGGGFRLGRPPEEITLFDVLEPIEQISRWNGCFLGLPDCSDEDPCPVHEQWGSLRDSYRALLSQTTIASVIGGVSPSRLSSPEWPHAVRLDADGNRKKRTHSP